MSSEGASHGRYCLSHRCIRSRSVRPRARRRTRARTTSQQRNQPGKFDFYVLALSWSPSFCKETEERGRENEQCRGRPYSFVVHGLWPQYESGFPRDCQVPAPRLNRNIMTSMLDLMPAPRLVYHEWDQHGTCSGLAGAGLLRPGAQGARGGENPRELYRAQDNADGDPGRGRGRLRQKQSRVCRARPSRSPAAARG